MHNHNEPHPHPERRHEHAPSAHAVAQTLLTDLRSILPEDAVIADEAELHAYECDGLSAYRQLPRVAVLPRTVAEV